MDLATVIGLVLTFGLIVVAIGEYMVAFIDIPSLLIVLGGTVGALLIWHPMDMIIGIKNVIRHAFFSQSTQITTMIATIIDCAGRARREGILSLQNVENEVDDVFFVKGINMVVDGLDSAVIEEVLSTEIDFMEERHKRGSGIFSTMAALSPAMGMIGTLVGLVIMLQNLSDPDAIGPSMAIALLTTFYGALIANVIAMPISGKLELRSQDELLAMRVVMSGVMAIAAGDNPRIVENKLNSHLPPKDRGTYTQ